MVSAATLSIGLVLLVAAGRDVTSVLAALLHNSDNFDWKGAAHRGVLQEHDRTVMRLQVPDLTGPTAAGAMVPLMVAARALQGFGVCMGQVCYTLRYIFSSAIQAQCHAKDAAQRFGIRAGPGLDLRHPRRRLPAVPRPRARRWTRAVPCRAIPRHPILVCIEKP